MEHFRADANASRRRIDHAVNMKLPTLQRSDQCQRLDGGSGFISVGKGSITRATKVQGTPTVGVEDRVVADRKHFAGPCINGNGRPRCSPGFLHRALQLPVLGVLKAKIKTQGQRLARTRFVNDTEIPDGISMKILDKTLFPRHPFQPVLKCHLDPGDTSPIDIG